MADDAIDSGDGLGQELVLDEASPARRKRTLWAALAVIAVAAGAVVVNTAGDDDPSRLPVALGAGGDAARGEAAATMSADMSMAAWVTYVAGDDLPAMGGSAPAYKLSGSVDEDQVEALGRALGLEGEITHTDGAWRLVTEDDGQVEVYDGFGGTWWYSSVTFDQGDDGTTSSSGGGSAGSTGSAGSIECVPDEPDPDVIGRCLELEAREEAVVDTTIAADTPVSSCATDTKCADPVPMPAPITPPADLPSQDEAREIALDLLSSTGVDVTDAKVTVDGPYDAWYVTIEPRLDGRAVAGLTATASIGSKGEVLNASGYLADAESLGDYPMVDTRAAIDRLNDQAGGWFAYAPNTAVAEQGEAEDAVADLPVTTSIGIATEEPSTTLAVPCEQILRSDVDDDADVATDPAVGCVGPTEPYVPPEPVEIVLHEAEEVLVLLPATDESGDAYLVPGYRFRGDQDTVVDGVAIDDDSLAPPPEVPVEEPATDLPVRTTDVSGREPAIEPGIEPAPPVEDVQP